MNMRRHTWGPGARIACNVWFAACLGLAAAGASQAAQATQATQTNPAKRAPDAARGEQLYVRCLACHALASDRVGPRHCGVLGRRAGSVAGFAYSPAMQHSGLVWNEKTLDHFLTKPLRVVPGSSMTYDGVPDATERADLIAFLKQANGSAACRVAQ